MKMGHIRKQERNTRLGVRAEVEISYRKDAEAQTLWKAMKHSNLVQV